jgi:hypothetical protein
MPHANLAILCASSTKEMGPTMGGLYQKNMELIPLLPNRHLREKCWFLCINGRPAIQHKENKTLQKYI